MDVATRRPGTSLVTGPWGVLVLAVPYAAVQLAQGQAASGLDAGTVGAAYGGIREAATILPELLPLIAFLTAFTCGRLLARRPAALEELGPRWGVHLGAAGIGSLVVLALTSGLGGTSTSSHVALAVASAISAWAWVYGLVGVATTHLRTERRWVRYLADASYWMYVAHLPLVLGIGALLTHLPWPAELKLLVTLGTTTAVLLLSYDAFVRSTWIGRWLNGRRLPRACRC